VSTNKITFEVAHDLAGSPESNIRRWVSRTLGSESQGGDLQDRAR